MTITRDSGRTTEPRRLAGWAVNTAVLAAVMFAVGLTVLAIVGFEADDEAFAHGKAAVVSIGLFGGVLISVVAFVLAVVAKVRHERRALLWFPLLLGPVLIFSFPFWFD